MLKRKTIIPNEGKTFKWISFTEQISRLNTDAVSSRLKLSGGSLDQETYFFAAIAEWNDKDYGDDYRAFLDDIPYDELASYAQLLHYKDEIFEALQHHLSIETSKAYPALLEIAVAFVRDLKDDFYPFLWDFFDTVIALIERNRDNADVLSAAFKSLANLFQIHWRTVTKSLRKAFVRFSPLFGSTIPYLRRFAAEAFSFLLRKSQAIPKLCQFLYEQAHESDGKHIKDGVSQLLFNGIKGVHKQFQTRTSELLKDFIQSAMDLENQAVKDTAMQILVDVMTFCCQWTSAEYSKNVTDVVLNLLQEQTNRKAPELNLKFLLNLIPVWITTKKGQYFTQELELLDILKTISSKSELQQLDSIFLDVISKTLCAYLSKFSDPGVMRQIISGGCLNYLQDVNATTVSSVFSFLESLLDLRIFDIWCTNSIAKILDLILESSEFNDDLLRPILKFFVIYTVKRRPFLEAIPDERKPFFDTSCFSRFYEQVVKKIKNLRIGYDDLGVYSLVIYPWLLGTWSGIPDGLVDMKELMKELLLNPSFDETTSLVTYLLVYDIGLLDYSYLQKLRVDDVLSYLKTHNISDEVVLRTAFMVLSASEDVLKVDHLSKLEEFATVLKAVLLSPSGIIRRWTLKVLIIFDSRLEHGHINEEGKFVPSESALSVFLQAEETPSTMNCYRNRGTYLRKVPFNLFEKMFPEGCSQELKKIPLTLAIAQLFERFTPLWPMAHDIVKDYARSMEFEDFWDVFRRALDFAKERIYGEIESEEVKDDVFEFIRKPKGDYISFRIQLFKMLINFPGYARRHDQYMVDTLLDIYKKEYYVRCRSISKTVDLSKQEDDGQQDVESEDESEDEVQDKPLKKKKKDEGNNAAPKNLNKKVASQTLKALLDVFSKFSNPKTLSREPELRSMYDELLKGDSLELQQAAFNCFLTYRYPFLNPYAEYFNALFDKKKFRDGLIHFSIDESNSAIEEAHRPELMPYLMKLLHGQLMIKTNGYRTKTVVILSYLAGSTSDELDLFFDEIFGTLMEYAGLKKNLNEQDICELCDCIDKKYDFSNTLSPRRLSSILLRLVEMTKRLTAVLREDQFKLLYRILVVIGILIKNALEREDKIEKFNIIRFKQTRLDYFDAFSNFFENLRKIELKKKEIDCLWNFVLEPMWMMQKPLSVINFFVFLTKLPGYFPLLIKEFSTKLNNTTPLYLVLEYLNSRECDFHAKNRILDGISALLTAVDEPCLVSDLPESKLKIREGTTYGIEILLRYLPFVIEFLITNIPTDASQAKKLPSVYLEILNKLSPYVEDIKVGQHFASTLLAYVEFGKIRNDDKVVSILHSICELVGFVDDARSFLRRLTKLISSVKQRGPRIELVKLVQTLANHSSLKNEESLVKSLNMFADLESFDKRHLENPDFEKRHEALAVMGKVYNAVEEKLDPLAIAFFARSHAYGIMNITDIALRSVTTCAFYDLIVYVAKYFSNESNIRLELLRKHFIQLISNGMRSTKDTVRDDFVKGLDLLVIYFSDDEPNIIKPLKKLKNDNPDDDFFVNIVHIQQHKRIKALKSLGDNLCDGILDISIGCLMKFILPIIRPYLITVEQKLLPLSDFSLKIFTEILKLTSWMKYEKILETYVGKLDDTENSKPVVRIITAIIDGFHFDLSNCKFEQTEFIAAINPKKTKRRLGTKIFQKDLKEKYEEEEKSEYEDEIEENITDNKQKDDPKVILETMVSTILPKLKKCLKPNQKGIGHKYSQQGKHYSDGEELKRAPIALATVKLLQKLPSFVLDQHLRGVILTLLHLLASRSNDVRVTARKTLERVVQSLGVKFLPFIVRELRETLNRGFRIHVMIFTVHHLIATMETFMKTGDLDPCLEEIIEVCNQEQFSDITEEKDMPMNVIEAKSNKTGDTFQYLGKFISCGMLMKVITPMRMIIDVKPSSTTMKKLECLLKSFANGLKMNKGIESMDLLEFSYLILRNNLDEMMKQVDINQSINDAEEKEKKAGYRPENCLIIPIAPKRMGGIVKTSIKSKVSIFVEFGINLLSGLLKAKVFSIDNELDIKKLDPFLDLILQCLKLKYEKITGASLKCLVSLLKFKLPSAQKNEKELIERLFVVLADYSSTEKVGELRSNIFKCITTLIHISSSSILTKKRLQILLNYAEADVMDSQRQATAFALIKAILNKVIKDEKIIEMMDYLGEISITSSLEHVRRSSREMMLIYITLYKIKEEELEKWLNFYLEQLEYEGEDGRLSALEMTNSIINGMTEEICSKFCLFIFIKLAARIANDESKKCVKFVLLTIRKLIQSTTEKCHNELLNVTKDWISAEKEGTVIIGCKVLNELARNLPNLVSSKLDGYMNCLICIIKEVNLESFSENVIISVIETLTILCQLIPDLFVINFIKDEINNILQKLNGLLRCTLSRNIQTITAGFFGQLLGYMSFETTMESEKLQNIISNTIGWLEIAYSMCFIMKNIEVEESTIDQIVKNLISLSTFINTDENFDGFMRRICSICTKEITIIKNQSKRRIGIFKMTAAIALKCSKSHGLILTKRIMPFLYREISGKSSTDKAQLQLLANEVGEILKEKIGNDEYSQMLIECSKKASEKKLKRKQEMANLVITNPEMAQEMKKAKTKKQAEMRKRKLDAEKPYRITKRRNRREINEKFENLETELF